MSLRRRLTALAVLGAVLVAGAVWARPAARPHNVIIFVADGLRYGMVTPQNAPNMARLKAEGVDFANSHSLMPTQTTANASAIATGHRLGDTGDFANVVWPGDPGLAASAGSRVADLEVDPVQGELNARYGGNYLNETTLLAAARDAGFQTAAVGKLGPIALQDVTQRDGRGTIVIDDDTGKPTGIPLAPEIAAAIEAAGLPTTAVARTANAQIGDFQHPGTTTANTDQQDWFLAVVTRVLLPRFKTADKPFVMVVWSRDPDGSQHDNGDSLNRLVPGINGPTSLAGIRNADDDLGRIRSALKTLGLERSTDIVVTADHGFSTVSKESTTSPAAGRRFADVPPGFLPPAFAMMDMAEALGLPLWDAKGKAVDFRSDHPRPSHTLLGADPAHPDIIATAQGGVELLWIDPAKAKALAPRIANAFARQDYAASIFADDRLGRVPGALTLSALGLKGSAVTPAPTMVLGFRSHGTGCPNPEICAAEISDTPLQQGQGNHGGLSRANTRNFMAAVGPDFRRRFVDPAPVSNADWAPTLARILHLDLHPKGRLKGRMMGEAMAGTAALPKVERRLLRASRGAGGFITEMQTQTAGGETYLDWAGARGRVVKGAK